MCLVLISEFGGSSVGVSLHYILLPLKGIKYSTIDLN